MQQDYFCLQCGEAVMRLEGAQNETIDLALTSDPILQRAINDIAKQPVVFKTPNVVPVVAPSGAVPPSTAPAGAYNPVQAQALHGPPPKPASTVPKRRHNYRHVAYGLVALLIVVSVVNAATGWYYHDRIYPGVKVAGISVGGESIARADAVIRASQPTNKIVVRIGETDFTLTHDQLGIKLIGEGALAKATAIGHNSPVPLVGLLSSFQGLSLESGYRIDEARLKAVVAQLASAASHPATDAAVVMPSNTPLLLSDKTGLTVSAADIRAGIEKALVTQDKVVINTTKITPQLVSASLKGLPDAIQTRINATYTVVVRSKSYPATQGEKSAWLRWNGDGSGIAADTFVASAYLGRIPGTFDRVAALSALKQAVASGQNLTYTASTRRVTTVGGTAQSQPQTVAYRYCVSTRGGSDEELATLADRVSQTYVRPDQWNANGRIIFSPAASDCNFTLWLVAPEHMADFSSACDEQSSCRVGNDVIINAKNWRNPVSWSGSLIAYQTELINHVTGHWLGFDHALCNVTEPPIHQTVVTVAGCSPQWWTVPPELQTLKILPGF